MVSTSESCDKSVETETTNNVSIEQISEQCQPPKCSSVNNNDSARSSRISGTEEQISDNDCVKHRYGWGNFNPQCLQGLCNAKWALFWLCWGGAMQGLIVNGFINVVISTIERRFGLRSRQTGLVASGYDIASFVCLVPVTYFGGRKSASKPLFIAVGVILMGLGSLTFALPHFLVGSYRATIAEMNVCESNLNGTSQVCADSIAVTANGDDLTEESLAWTVWFFFAAQLLHGAGASPLFTLGVTYIDENVSKKMSSVYLGIYYTMAIIGPAVGYVLGGQLLLIYTDFMSVDPAQLSLTNGSKVWIGAWWIGFVFAAIGCVILAIPILGYPKSLPGAEKLQLEKVSEAHDASATKATPHKYNKNADLPRALHALFKNPTFFFLNLAGATEGLVIAGFAAFLPKQIENQFSISPVWSALLMGLITVPAGGGGTFLGGYLVKKLNLNCKNIIKMCLMVTLVATCFTACFLISCPNMGYAGVTSLYRNSEDKFDANSAPLTLESMCNADCACSRVNYDPVCGADGIMYYSPCFAGCKYMRTDGFLKVYGNCTCIGSENITDMSLLPYNAEASNTMCQSSCRSLPYFVALCFILMLFTFLATMPALSATLRCVHDEQRSFALGIQWIKVRLLGTIPAPMIFGILIDETCLLWYETCDDLAGGACLVYDNAYISKYMWILALTAKFCSVVFFLGAWWFYIPPNKPPITKGEGN